MPEAHISTTSPLLQNNEGCIPSVADLVSAGGPRYKQTWLHAFLQETAEITARSLHLPLEYHSTGSGQQSDDSSDEQIDGGILVNQCSPTSSSEESTATAAESAQISLQLVAIPMINAIPQSAGKRDSCDKAADLPQTADTPSPAIGTLPLFATDPVTQPIGDSSSVSLSVPLEPSLFNDPVIGATYEQNGKFTAERNDVAELPLGALQVSLPQSTDLQPKCATSEVDFQDNVASPTAELSSMSAIFSPLDASASVIATLSVLAGLDGDAYVSAEPPCGVPQMQDCEQTTAGNRMEEPVEMAHHDEYPASDDLGGFEVNSENVYILVAESYGLAGDADETQLEVLFSGEPSSSPLPSSSPPQIFSSSPQDQDLPTPPSSSPISAGRTYMDEKDEKEAPASPTVSAEQQGDIVIKSVIDYTVSSCAAEPHEQSSWKNSAEIGSSTSVTSQTSESQETYSSVSEETV